MKKNKVYCEECEYLECRKIKMVLGEIFDDLTKPSKCHCSENCYYKSKKDWYSRYGGRIQKYFRKIPSKINKNNNCKWFSKNKKK